MAEPGPGAPRDTDHRQGCRESHEGHHRGAGEGAAAEGEG